jgi:hypothetical protein
MSQVESLTIVQRGETLTITTQADYDAGGEYLKGATALVRQIQEYHKPLKQAADRAHQAIIDAEKKELAPINAAISRVKGLRIGFERQAALLAEQQRKKLQMQADKQAAKSGLPAVVIQAYQPVTKTRGISNRSTWRAEPVDEKLTPREYLIPDQKALDEAAKRMKGEFNIPGWRAVEDTNEIVRL